MAISKGSSNKKNADREWARSRNTKYSDQPSYPKKSSSTKPVAVKAKTASGVDKLGTSTTKSGGQKPSKYSGSNKTK